MNVIELRLRWRASFSLFCVGYVHKGCRRGITLVLEYVQSSEPADNSNNSRWLLLLLLLLLFIIIIITIFIYFFLMTLDA